MGFGIAFSSVMSQRLLINIRKVYTNRTMGFTTEFRTDDTIDIPTLPGADTKEGIVYRLPNVVSIFSCLRAIEAQILSLSRVQIRSPLIHSNDEGWITSFTLTLLFS